MRETVVSCDGKNKGRVVGERRCRLDGCTGLRKITRWPDGKRTEPCTKGMSFDDATRTWKIL